MFDPSIQTDQNTQRAYFIYFSPTVLYGTVIASVLSNMSTDAVYQLFIINTISYNKY